MVKRIEAQAKARERELMGVPIRSVEDALERNYRLGIAAGMKAAVNLPEKLVELDREEFTKFLEEERNGTE